VLVGLNGRPASAVVGPAFAGLLAAIAALVYEWYIARVALSVTGAQATLVSSSISCCRRFWAVSRKRSTDEGRSG